MADGASISQLSHAFVAEVTRGTTPASPAYNYIPIRQGSQLQVDKNFEQSTLINATRDPGARIGGVAGWSGTISCPLVRETGLDKLLESTLSGAFATVSPGAITGSWAAAGKTFTRATGNFLTASLTTRIEVGDLLFAAGTTNNQTQLNGAIASTTATTVTVDTVDATTVIPSTGAYVKIDNEILLVTARTATSLTVTRGALGTTAATHADNAPVLIGRVVTAATATVLTFANALIVDEASVATTFTGTTSVLVPSTTRTFGTFEQKFGDINLYEIFKGGEVNTAQFNCPTSGEIGIEFALLGTKYATGQVGSSTYTATASRTPFAASVAGSALTKDGAALGTCVENLQFTVNNNRALKYGVGEQFACFVEEGIRQIDLTFGLYLVDGSFQMIFQAETRFGLNFTAVSADGDKYQFVFPRLVMTSLPRQVSGQTFVENAAASAEKDSVSGSAFWIRKIVGS